MPLSSLVAIVGPTGSGKSALAIAVAKSFDGAVVNFDSVQIYRKLNIGSAKTLPAERMGVAHYLIDVVDPRDELTAGGYSEMARGCLRDLAARGELPVMAGGTGFYLRSLLDGLSPAPKRDSELRERLTAVAGRNGGALHRFLRRVDRAAAGRIHPNDHQKLIRAIELADKGGEVAPRDGLVGFRVLKIGLSPDRAELYARINRRTAAMFEGGLLEETQALLEEGVPAAAKSLQSLGYKQAVAVLEGRMGVAAAVEEVQTKTRQYAKRQLTWFRREEVVWLEGFGGEEGVEQAAKGLVEKFLKTVDTLR